MIKKRPYTTIGIAALFALTCIFCSCSGSSGGSKSKSNGGSDSSSSDPSASENENTPTIPEQISGLLPPDVDYGESDISTGKFEAKLQIFAQNEGNGEVWKALVTGEAHLHIPEDDPFYPLPSISVSSIMEKMEAIDAHTLRVSFKKQGGSTQEGLEIHEMCIIFDTIDDSTGQRTGRITNVSGAQYTYFYSTGVGFGQYFPYPCDKYLEGSPIVIKFAN